MRGGMHTHGCQGGNRWASVLVRRSPPTGKLRVVMRAGALFLLRLHLLLLRLRWRQRPTGRWRQRPTGHFTQAPRRFGGGRARRALAATEPATPWRQKRVARNTGRGNAQQIASDLLVSSHRRTRVAHLPNEVARHLVGVASVAVVLIISAARQSQMCRALHAGRSLCALRFGLVCSCGLT